MMLNPAKLHGLHTRRHADSADTANSSPIGTNGINGTRHAAAIEPDLSIVDRARTPAPPIDLALFGQWADWITRAAEAKNAPTDYVAFALLSGMAGAVGAARWVSPWDGWREPCVLWAALIGAPSASKSPALDSVTSPLAEVEREISVDYAPQMKAHAEAAAVAATYAAHWETAVAKAIKAGAAPPAKPTDACAPPEPVLPRIMVTDATIEALAAVLAGNPRGLMLARDELAAWLANLGKYGDGDRAFFLEGYGGRPYVVDRRKLAEPLRLDHLALSICGGIPPDRLASLAMTGDDDGLLARFLLVWPGPVPPCRPRHGADAPTLTRALRRLRSLDFITMPDGKRLPVTLPIAASALPEFEAWRSMHHAASAAVSGLAASAWGKMPGQALRIALTLELAAWAAGDERTEPSEVSENTLGAALDMIEGYVKPMLDRALGEAALPRPERDAATLGRAIRTRGTTTINAREVRREWRLPGLTEAAPLDAAIAVLVDARWLIPAPSREGATPGRHAKTYAVHPVVIAGGGA